MAHNNAALTELLAEQLAAELETYQRLLDDLRAGGWSIEPAVALADTVDRVQRCAENLPRVRVALAEFLITRTELSRRIVGAAAARTPDLALLHADHVYATNALRRAALHLLAVTRRGAGR